MDLLQTQLAMCKTEKILATKTRDKIKLEYDTLKPKYDTLQTTYDKIKLEYDTLKPKYDTLQTTYDNLHNALANLDVDAEVPGYSCIDYDDEPTEAQFSRKPTPSSGINSSSIVFIIISLVFFVLFLTMLRGMMIGGK